VNEYRPKCGDVLRLGIKRIVRFITFRVSRRRREIYCGHARLCVCLSVAACLHYCSCTDSDVTWWSGREGMPLSCTLLGGFPIGARVALPW